MTPEELKALHEEQLKLTKQMRETAAKLEAEAATLGGEKALTKEKFDKISDRLNEIETKMSRPPVAATSEATQSAHQKSFMQYLRQGGSPSAMLKSIQADLSPMFQKALTMADDTQAGYLATFEFVQEILKNYILYSPVRSIARVRTTSMKEIKIPKRTGTFAAQWVADQGLKSETTGLKYGQEVMPSHEMYALVDVAADMLEDSAFDLEAELRGEFAEQFGVAEGLAFVGGNGIGKPQGFTDSKSGITPINSIAVNQFQADDILELFYGTKIIYANAGEWCMNRAILKQIRKFKDSQNRYLWEPGINGAAAPSILSRPYYEMTDMDATVATGKQILAFGDFSKGYIVLDRVMMNILRDEITQATVGNIRFIARKRVGGQVVLPEAINILKVA